LWLCVCQSDGSAGEYEGALKALPLRDALDEVAAAEPLPEAQREAAAAAGGGGQGDQGKVEAEERPKGLPGLEVGVHTLAVTNLSSIDEGAGMWLMGFYSSAGQGARGGGG
jgi:hypothetical protein